MPLSATNLFCLNQWTEAKWRESFQGSTAATEDSQELVQIVICINVRAEPVKKCPCQQ